MSVALVETFGHKTWATPALIEVAQ